MKAPLSKKSKIIILTVSIFAVTLVLGILFIPTFISSQFNKFDMQPDSDTGFYSSAQGRIAYSDNSLSVFDNKENITQIHTENSKEEVNTFAIKYNGFDIYTDDSGLNIKNNDFEHSIKGETSKFDISNNNVIYQTDNCKLSIYNLEAKSTQIFDAKNKIYWFAINNDNFFLATHYEDEALGKIFKIYVCDINTLEINKTFTCSLDDNSIFLNCNNDIYVAIPPMNNARIYKVDFDVPNLKQLFSHLYVQNIVATDTNIIFNAEKQSTKESATDTVENKNNGLWAYDFVKGEVTKLSDECVFDDLVATENYVYGFTKEYMSPEDSANNEKGYKITQIPIK